MDGSDLLSSADNPLRIFGAIVPVNSKDENLLKYESPYIHEILVADCRSHFSVFRRKRKLRYDSLTFFTFIVFIEVNIRNCEGIFALQI